MLKGKRGSMKKNPDSHKKELQQRRENNKKRDHRVKSNRKRKVKKIKRKPIDYVVKVENSGSQVER